MAAGGWETAGGGTVVPSASRSVKNVTATKLNFGRETCIEEIYIMKFMRMVTVACVGFYLLDIVIKYVLSLF